MKLELGKFYKTSEGHKVECVAVWLRPDFNGYQATVMRADKHTDAYTLSGQYSAGEQTCRWNIVAEWRDPVKVEGWVNVYPSGNVSTIYATQLMADGFADQSRRSACVFVQGTEEHT